MPALTSWNLQTIPSFTVPLYFYFRSKALAQFESHLAVEAFYTFRLLNQGRNLYSLYSVISIPSKPFTCQKFREESTDDYYAPLSFVFEDFFA